jgi:hypothetical protein
MKVPWFSVRFFAVIICSLSGVLVASLTARAQYSKLVDIPNVIDPAKADVLGLRLYMSAKEASATIQDRLQVNVAGRECGQDTPCISYSNTELTPRKKYVDRIYIHNSRLDLSLTFTESFPFDAAKPELLTGISYTPVLESSTAQDAFVLQVRQKYGPPAPVAQAAVFWCTRGLASGGFTDITHSQVTACDGPSLVLQGPNLYLSDKGLLSREKTQSDAIKGSAPPAL